MINLIPRSIPVLIGDPQIQVPNSGNFIPIFIGDQVVPVFTALDIPGVTLVIPRVDRSDSFRAGSISDMWRMLPDLLSNIPNIDYKLGIPADGTEVMFVFQNKCAEDDLLLNLYLPEFLVSTPTFPLTVRPNTIIQFGIKIVESALRNYLPGQKASEVLFTIAPQGVTGPVMVLKNVSDIIDPNLPVPAVIVQVIEPPPPETDPLAGQSPCDPVTIEKFVWKNGTTGETQEGSPPVGWVAEIDGAFYPALPVEPPPAPEPFWINGITNERTTGFPPSGWISAGQNVFELSTTTTTTNADGSTTTTTAPRSLLQTLEQAVTHPVSTIVHAVAAVVGAVTSVAKKVGNFLKHLF